MKLLVSGGAGYIGSHAVKYAQECGHEVVVLDDFSTGHKEAIEECEIIEVNLLEQEKLIKFLGGRHFDGVIHFAAKSLVGESIKNPYMYYETNLKGTLNLLNLMLINNITDIVFSSSAAIFGNPVSEKIDEKHIKNPINPYGMSKLMVENILKDLTLKGNINASCLRYFNAAGAHKSGLIGESHDPETHLIPTILESIKNSETFKIFGNDYLTPDGTCIRDYIHVDDLAEAHILSLNYIKKNKGFSAFNLGNGKGFSVLDIIKACKQISNSNINYEIQKKREGDPPKLVADITKAGNILQWKPRHSKIDKIISSAWKWHSSNRKY